MGIMSFIKDAGEKLFGHKQAEAAAAAAQSAPDDAAKQAALQDANQTAATAIESYIATQHLSADGLNVGYDCLSRTATVAGSAADQATKEKILLCAGNVQGVEHVSDLMTVAEAADESRFYTVKSGDVLSGIAKHEYGNAGLYMKIFEANRPMLGHPDKIYPGQVLRIPA